MLPLIALTFFATLAEAKVLFQHAAIYDQYDLTGVAEIGLDSCVIGGCSVFVSTPQWNIESTRNIFVVSTGGANVSLYSYATEVDPVTWAKKGVKTASTEVKIQNRNSKDVGPIVIYVVGTHAANYGSANVEIYDAANIAMRPATNKQQTMIMSAEPFNLYVEAYANNGNANLNAYVSATGFENNYNRVSPDGCTIIYEHNEGKPFRLRINSPVITVNFDGQTTYRICANIDSNNAAVMDYPGIATSQGYVGCSGNYFAVYRSSLYTPTQQPYVFELKDSNNADRQTELVYFAKTKQSDKLAFTTYYTGGSDNFEAPHDGSTVTRTENANRINVVFNNGYSSSYSLKYTPKTGAVTIPSAQGICPDWSKTSTVPPVTVPTTSGANELFTALTSSIALFIARHI